MTTIEWTDETWNPTVGCSKVSPGCDHCYAIGVAHRAMQPAHEGLTIRRPGERPDWTGEVRCLPDRLDTPLHWRRPRRVFVDSMSDLFHPEVPAGFVSQVFDVMRATPRHTYQILTKRPQLMARLLACRSVLGGDPPPNVWLGTSIESDRYAWRADHLRATPAAVRFLSCEPLLSPLPSLDLAGIDWVIVGGESGPGARPMHPDWVRDLRDRCVDAGVAFFFKQWGSWAPRDVGPATARKGVWLNRDGAFGHGVLSPDARPGWTAVFPHKKSAAGRQLDGRTWDEMPGVRRG